MNKLELATGLSDHHKIRVNISWTHYYLKLVYLIIINNSKAFMNTIVVETGFSGHHEIRVKVSSTH